MRSEPWQLGRVLSVAALVAAFAFSQNLHAQAPDHLVSPSQLQKATVDASQSRQQNLDTLRDFLSSAQAQKALDSAHINQQQVNKAVAGLSDTELAQLAARADKAQSDFAAGNIDDRDLLIILVCIAALILIIVAVH
ncbi:MAG: PA2779 family protein [Acidobacteriota bacterium]|nr:PA2779 family protein [Acidobacteriota bacterium]